MCLHVLARRNAVVVRRVADTNVRSLFVVVKTTLAKRSTQLIISAKQMNENRCGYINKGVALICVGEANFPEANLKKIGAYEYVFWLQTLGKQSESTLV